MRRAMIALASAGLLLGGCRVNTSGKDNVDVNTALGDLHVKTDPAAVSSKIGLAVLPGAQPEKESGHDKSAADVGIGFGDFKLHVVAAGYTTPEKPADVQAFYTKELAQYGDVLVCRNKQPVGSLQKTGQGLTCGDGNGNATVYDSDDSGEGNLQLRAGSRRRFHLVGIRSEGTGTHFQLVSLQLPGKD